MEPLPSTFKGLYRLVLRSCSATVLHQKLAKRHLRSIYRPVFDTAALMMRQFQIEEDALRKADIGRKLDIWNQRMDNTLTFMYHSSQSRGLPHQVTQNLSDGVRAEKRTLWGTEREYEVWDPRSSPTPAQTKKAYDRLEKKRVARDAANEGPRALAELIHLAEGYGGISLGRVMLRRPVRKLS